MNETLNDFSLLYPDAAKRAAHLSGLDAPHIDEFTLEELEKYSKAKGWIDVCKLPEPAAE